MKDDPITPADLELTRWLDNVPGANAPENLTPLEKSRLRAEASAVADLLRRHVPASVEPPYPDFFNSHILKKIREDYDSAPPESRQPQGGWWAMLGSFLRSPWIVAPAMSALAVFALVTLRHPGSGDALTSGTRVLSVFSPELNATTSVNPGFEFEAVIITVDGLDAFPDDRTVVGLLNDESRALIASH